MTKLFTLAAAVVVTLLAAPIMANADTPSLSSAAAAPSIPGVDAQVTHAARHHPRRRHHGRRHRHAH